MKLLIKQALVVDPRSIHHQNEVDILVENGIITKIANAIEDIDAQVIRAPGLRVAPGWIDMRVHLSDPGFEPRESILQTLDAAAFGGFTRIVALPDTEPVIQNKSAIHYILKQAEKHAVDLLPTGAISQDMQGKELAELIDMLRNGAIAFSNGDLPLSAGCLQRALRYLLPHQTLILEKPIEASLTAGGQMHEGVESTLLGLKGIPAHAETIAINRNIEILQYSGGKLHLNCISTKEGVQQIIKARENNLSLSADVAINNLVFTDNVLHDYNTNFKVNPPLRDQLHKNALVNAVVNGDIQVIVSDHKALDIEHKDVEFDYAAFGTTGLQTMYSAYCMNLQNEISETKWVESVAINPARLLNLELPIIESKQKALLTLFSPDLEWTYNQSSNLSNAINSPWYNQKLKGKAVGIINEYQFIINHES